MARMRMLLQDLLLLVRHVGRAGADWGRFAVRTGRWWFPLVVAVLIVGGVLAAATKVVVPTVVYTLF